MNGTRHPHLQGVRVYVRGRHWWCAIGSRRQSTGLCDDAGAEAALRAAEAIYYEREEQARGVVRYSVQRLILEYLRVKSGRLEAATVEVYTRSYELLLSHDREVADTAAIRGDVLGAVDRLWAAGYSAQTVRRALVYVRALFTYAVEAGHCVHNPVPRHLIPGKPSSGGRPFTEGEVQRIEAQLEAQAKAGRQSAGQTLLLVRLLVRSGLRIGEALRLRGGDYAGGVLRVQGKPSPRTPGLRVREIPVDVLPGLREVCDEVFRGVPEGARAFEHAANCHQKNFRQAAQALRLEGRIHELRDTAVNWWEKGLGIPEHLCARLAGHSVEVRRKHYDRPPTAEELREAIGRSGVPSVPTNVPNLSESA